MDDPTTVGARVKVLRRWRRMSQQTAADLAGLSQPHLSKIEAGTQALDSRSKIAGLARALRVSETDIIGGPHLSDDPVQSEAHTGIPALRVALETNNLRTATYTGRPRPLELLATELEETIKPLAWTANYAELAGHLPGLIDELHVYAADPPDEAAYVLALGTLIDACLRASALSKHLGYSDLAHLAATRAAEAAGILDTPVNRGKAEFMRVLTMPRAGSWDRTLMAAERAANDLEPHARQPLDLQVLGMLALTASLSAAAVRDAGSADHWLGEAEQLAGRVPDQPAANWEMFSATNAKVWRILVGVELGESGGTLLEKAKMIDQRKLEATSSRRAAFLADTARGLARDPKTRDEAVRWFRRAEDLAPQRTRNNRAVKHTLEVLHTQALAAAVGVELRGMMARMGIPH